MNGLPEENGAIFGESPPVRECPQRHPKPTFAVELPDKMFTVSNII